VAGAKRRSRFGENKIARKKIQVASKTIDGPDGISQNAEIRTPATDVETPMMIE
jgi:hypothetical protein